MKQSVENFLNRHCINPDSIDMDYLVSQFLNDMRLGLAGKKSSLAMIPSYCSVDAKPKKGESVIVIDAGGTNLRTCLVTFGSSASGSAEDLSPVISDFKKSSMPGVKKEVSASEFFSILADEVERLIDKSDRIGFCFSYAVEILPDHDGIPVLLSKEVKAPEIIGKRLGKGLMEELGRRGHDVSKKKILILNDAVATLLAGQSRNINGPFDSCVGFILGTGTNTSYVEKTRRIGKLKGLGIGDEGYQIINVESGNMSVSLGDLDREFLDGTVEPSRYMFEKMISGAYLGPLARVVLGAAVREGLFSAKFGECFEKLTSLSTIEVSEFLDEESGFESVEREWTRSGASVDSGNVLQMCCGGNEEDYDTLMDILGCFIERAAKLTAANLASAVLITNFGKDEDHPVLINADGTTFYRTAYLRSYTTEYLEAYLAEKGRRAVLTRIEDSPIIGSAIGALTL